MYLARPAATYAGFKEGVGFGENGNMGNVPGGSLPALPAGGVVCKSAAEGLLR
jgi:hypothetical protein